MSANRLKGEVAFEAEGESYTLLLDFNALCDLEDSLPGLMDGTAEIKSPKAIRRVFHAGLAAHHPQIDERGAGSLIHAVGFAEAGELVRLAFEASFPGADGGKVASRPQKAPPKAGAGSGR